jgi:hypothetical protein
VCKWRARTTYHSPLLTHWAMSVSAPAKAEDVSKILVRIN